MSNCARCGHTQQQHARTPSGTCFACTLCDQPGRDPHPMQLCPCTQYTEEADG